MSFPKISILLPVFNCELYLKQAMDSLLSQSFGDIEIIAVDDGSTDLSNLILKDYVKKDKRVVLIEQSNQGIVSALNRALFAAHGEFCVRMDADDVSHLDRIAFLKKHLDENLDLVVVGTQGYILDRDGRPVMPLTVKKTNEEIQYSLLYTRNQDGIIHASTIFRTEVARNIGGYREKYIYAEDLDFFLRMGEFGRIENLDVCLYYYRQHSFSISKTRAGQQYRNAVLAIRDACKRRMIPFTLSEDALPLIFSEKVQSEVDFLISIASAAEMYNNRITALMNVKEVLIRYPLTLAAWKILFLVFLPNSVKLILRYFKRQLKYLKLLK